MAEKEGGRRLVKFSVLEASLREEHSGPIYISASLFRVHDDKEIPQEKVQSDSIVVKAGTVHNLDFEGNLGDVFNLNHETGNPLLRIFVLAKKASGFTSSKVPIGVVEIDLDDVPSVEEDAQEYPLSPILSPGKGSAAEADPEGDPKEWIRAKVFFSKEVTEHFDPSAKAVIFDVDEDVEEDKDEVPRRFMDELGKKTKKKTLPRDRAVQLAHDLLYGVLDKGKKYKKEIKKRYESFTDGAKNVTKEEFVDFYRSIRPVMPNELQVVIIRAEGLMPGDSAFGGANSRYPYVQLIHGKQIQQSKAIKKNLNPFWNEKFSFRAPNPQISLQLIIRDTPTVAFGNFLGRTTVNLKSLLDKAPAPTWLELRNEKGQTEVTSRGRIQVILKWRLELKNEKMLPFELREEEEASSDEDDEEEDEGDDENPKLEEDDEEEKKAKEDAEKEKKESLMKEQAGMKIITGDYQVHVHIIECRDLKAKDLNGMSDPLVTIEMFGQKMNTAVVYSTLSPVFDDLLIFNMKNLDKDEFEEGLIRISVKDSGLLGETLIGSYSFDATYVYFQKNHELYQSWVALLNEVDPSDEGVQGYLKLSVQVVGPNDKLVIHREGDAPAKADDGDIGSMVLMPPTVKKEKKWLVITVHCGDYFPIMDEAIGAGGVDIYEAGIDAFHFVQFSDSKIATHVVKTKGMSRHMINPEFNCELWIPVTTPSATDRVKHIVYDYDLVGGNDDVSCFSTKFKDVEKKGKIGPTWFNLYGAPTTATAPLNPLEENWLEKYNQHPEKGSTYRGRVLISQKVRDELPKSKGELPFAPWSRKVKMLHIKKHPRTHDYVLKVGFIAGSELPKIPSSTGLGGARKMGVMIQIGKYTMISSRAANNNGCCEWSENKSMHLELPDHRKCEHMLPDVCIYLFTGKTAAELVPMCFTRIKMIDLIEEKFSGAFRWYTLQEDRSLNELAENTFPGCVLLRLGLGTNEVANQTEEAWNKQTTGDALSQKVPYIVRVHIFMCRDLPVDADEGSIDPYLRVNVNGASDCTSVKPATRDPIYFEVFDFKCELNHNFGFQLAPRVCIQMWDSDSLITQAFDDYQACCMLDVKEHGFVDACREMDEYTLDSSVRSSLPSDIPESIPVLDLGKRVTGSEFPDPKWVNFMIEKEGDAEGQLLALVQLIPSSPGHALVPPKPNVFPESMPAFLEITTLGCRNLIPYQFLPITLPRVQFVLQTAEELLELSSPDSKKPSPQDPNFLRYDIIKVEKFPVKSIFAPRLQVKAFDTRLGGLLVPNIGNCTVPLETKLPWSAEYVAYESTFSARTEAILPDEKPPEDEEEEVEVEEEEEEEEDEVSRLLNLEAKKVVVPMTPDEYKVRLGEMAGNDDTGAGVFGALKHLEKERAAEEALLSAAFVLDEEDEEDEPDKPPKYMIGRKFLDGTLEEVLKTTPFETFDLELGSWGGEMRSVGRLKGLFRVMDHEPTKEEAPFDLSALLKPQNYKVRFYILKAFALEAMDEGWGGKPGKSDPYLAIQLGKETFDGRNDYIEDEVEADFYRSVEVNAELPGAGSMIVRIMDYDTFGDELIGQTIIDLEDRWFDERWQQLGMEYLSKDSDNARYAVKPIEIRPLQRPPEKGNLNHGLIECWTDILLPAEASAFEADHVELPPNKMFEVRVIIWKAKDVVAMDTFEDMNDTYVRANIEGTDPQTTDTHWRAKKGKASWNWRMKFDVELGVKTRASKFPYLTLSMVRQEV